ncbi:uncharacterized protein CC84DRAFT_1222900 [Paraphaeosphaeria sporulosa]|uniref:Uncharacterized protein n=1 Tax=Paraphaeosphaeria sporulosa TaxID=1460663 RepID=A0A177BXF5_9PLEO|nr:uncharacterized protein CC84DRAFT_1222900 [Paraphaeosphaeria sporulosa]OAF99197.1 hypothetical protein CC84DRAFT_1222900 [Paraphaeosphaeria sporulosa]
MARDSSYLMRDDLLQLDDQLLDEGFGFLMSLLPRELFHLYNERIVINSNEYDLQDRPDDLVIAYVTRPGDYVRALKIGVDANAIEKHEFPPSLKRKKGDQHVELVHLGEADIEKLNSIPPLSWDYKLDAGYERSPECRDQTIALIKYYLLVWAAKNSLEAPLPQPNYQHLVAAFKRLTTTHYYKHHELIDEDDERKDVQMCLRKGEDDLRPLDRSDGQKEPVMVNIEKDDAEGGHSARTSRETSGSSYKPSAIEPGRELAHAAKLPTPRQTPKQQTLDVDMVDVPEESTRATSVNSSELATSSLDADVALSFETEALIRQSLPTPDTLVEEAIVETDPTLRDIRKKMGPSTLSLLPLLTTCTFKKIHTKDKGFLGLRLLLGTFREDTSRPELEGCEAWASFKMHDKNDRAAPRMHVHAFCAGTDKIVEDDLKIKDVLPDLQLGPAFTSIQGGDRAEELLLKALVKYFFIIAARDKVLGFDKHKMPFNGSFVDQLKIACKRVQMHDSARDDQRAHSRPLKRVKRSHNPTPRPSASLSDADEDVPAVRTRDARRSGRRTGQPSSAAVSESEDNIPAFVPVVPQQIPRRLALGVRIIPLMEGHTVNEFLDPDAEVADSDGDSGDEIPPPISNDMRLFLENRHSFTKQMKNLGESVKYYKTRKESTIMGIRKVKGMLNKNTMAPPERAESERGLAHRRFVETTIGTHLAMKEEGLEGWKTRVKQVNKEAAHIDPRVIDTWDLFYRV